MKRALEWAILVAVMISTLGIAYGSYTLADRAWTQVVDYAPAYTQLDLPASTAGEPIADRVVYVIVDGMRESISREMETLEDLREHGTDVVATTSQPSLSFPTWTTLLSGTPHSIHGVTTNWFEGPVRVETLIDTTADARVGMVISGPEDFRSLYDVGRADAVYLKEWDEDSYLSGELVDAAVRLTEEYDPRFVLVHLPDLDDAGHAAGGVSEHYSEVASRIDDDLRRLVDALQDGRTAFVICADHGHVDAGGHGGPEPEVVRAPAVFAGYGVAQGSAEVAQEDIAPTVAALLGTPTPRHALGKVIEVALEDGGSDAARLERATFTASYLEMIGQPMYSVVDLVQMSDSDVDRVVADAQDSRLARERDDRIPLALAILILAVAAVVAVGIASWRALVAASVGTLVYYVVYNGSYFLVHGYRWSLSAFNEESMLKTFFNMRMAETLLAGLVATLVAGCVYVLLRSRPKGPHEGYLAGWLVLGPATVLVIQATLSIQVAWYIWRWGVDITWLLPDLAWGFKFDLDLVQMTALGVAAVLAPVVTYLVGRYHPRVRAADFKDVDSGIDTILA